MKRTIRVLLVLLVAAALFLAGLVVGSRRMGAILFTALEHEVAGSLFASVESLASLRLGEPGAVEGQLEGRLQNAVISLRHPPEAPNSGLEAVLAEIPDQALDLESQSPFVRRRSSLAGGRPEESLGALLRRVTQKNRSILHEKG